MRLPSYVKPKPKLWNYLPWLSSFTANAIYPNIYLPQEIYNNLKSKNPDPKHQAVLIHEQTHLKRQQQMGWFIFGIKYLIFPKFRLNEELIAIQASMKIFKEHQFKFDLNGKAKILSSWLYLWPASYKDARKQLAQAWSEVGKLC